MNLLIAISSSGLTAATVIELCKYSNPGSLYVCSGRNFTGTCHYYTPTKQNDCFTINETVKSIEPDKGVYCMLFTTSDRLLSYGPEPQ